MIAASGAASAGPSSPEQASATVSTAAKSNRVIIE
jgi:hypothetical protein